MRVNRRAYRRAVSLLGWPWQGAGLGRRVPHGGTRRCHTPLVGQPARTARTLPPHLQPADLLRAEVGRVAAPHLLAPLGEDPLLAGWVEPHPHLLPAQAETHRHLVVVQRHAAVA